MDAKTKGLVVLFGVMLAAILSLIGALSWQQHVHRNQVTQLQNQVAERDKTIEVQKGLYTKLTVQTDDVKGVLDQKDQQVKELQDQVKKQGQDLLTASTLVVTWKKAYEGMANSTQTDVPPTAPGKPSRVKVDFHQDFGYVKVDGWTITNPVQSWLSIKPGRPLRLTLALSQDKTKAWHTYVTSSEENVETDIRVTAVNPYLLEPKWYEHIGVGLDLGAGTNQSGLGALVGLGVSYQFMQFTLGPHVWMGLNDRVDRYYGLSFEWRPFQRK